MPEEKTPEPDEKPQTAAGERPDLLELDTPLVRFGLWCMQQARRLEQQTAAAQEKT